MNNVSKSQLRNHYLKVLESIPFNRQNDASYLSLIQLREIVSSRMGPVMSFMSMEHELNLRPLNLELADQGRLVLPRVPKPKPKPFFPKLDCYYIDFNSQLIKSNYGIWEPNPDLCVKADPEYLSIVLVPAVAFDKNNVRLGHGGGYYDWLLSQVGESTLKIGVGYLEQMSETDLPKEDHDQVLDRVILF